MCLGSVCLISLFLLFGAVCKPNFFWKSTEVLALRRRFGDRGAEIFYSSIAGSLFLVAWSYSSSTKVRVWLVGLLIVVLALAFLSTLKSGRLQRRRKQTFIIKQGFIEKFKERFEEWRCASLKRKLLQRLQPDTASRLITSARFKTPGKPEHWYLEKVLYDLKRGR
jgi:hypothetical protein